MTTTFKLSSSRQRFNNGCGIDVNSGSMGGLVNITTSADFSLVPPTTFNMYYFIYVIKTDSVINVTLPSSTDVTTGWKARIILVSAANTGIINLISAGSNIGTLSSVGLKYIGVEIQLVNISGILYRITYFIGNTTGEQLLIPYNIVSGNIVPTIRPYYAYKFFSYSGLAGSASIDGNTTTLVAIPWDSNTPGRYVDQFAFDTSVSTRIYPTIISAVVRVNVCVYVNSTGGATNVNTLSVRQNGSSFTIASTVTSTSPAGSQILYLTCGAFAASTATNYIEIMIGKSTASVGSNLVDRISTYLFAEYFYL